MFSPLVSLVFIGLTSAANIQERFDQWLPEAYIRGGQDADEGQFPYQVSLRQLPSASHICGGSVVSNQWVLTAAHCVDGGEASNFRVVVGATYLDRGGVFLDIDRIERLDYDPDLITNDLALLHTAQPITIGGQIAAIPIASSQFGSGTAIVSGWGRLSSIGSVPNTMQWLERKVLSPAQCQAINSFMNDDNICTEGQSGEGFCFGDSGGPLVADGEQIGVVSFMIGYCGAGNPDGYVNVFFHRNWINGIIS